VVAEYDVGELGSVFVGTQRPRYKIIAHPIDMGHDHIGRVNFNDLIPPGTTWNRATTEAIHARLKVHSLEEVLCACHLECMQTFHAGDMSHVLTEGPLKDYRIDLPGIAYVARQALVACTSAHLPPGKVRPAVRDAVRFAAIDVHHHEDYGTQGKPLDIADTLSFLFATSGWQSQFIIGHTLRRVKRYLAIYNEALPAHRGIGKTLSEAFQQATGMTYAEFVGIGLYIFFVIATKHPQVFYPTISVDALTPLWTDTALSRHYTKEKVDTFFRMVSRPVEEQQRRAAAPFQGVGVAWDHPTAFNTLRRFPLVELPSGHHVIPVPQFLPLRITDDALWDMVDHFKAGSREQQVFAAMGEAFEGYVGRLLVHRYGKQNVHAWGGVRLGDPRRIKQGPDFAVVRNRSVLLLEAKKATPTLPLDERGDLTTFTELLSRNVIEPLRMLPEKQDLLFADEQTRNALPLRHADVIHAVVTLGDFLYQPFWWVRYVMPLLQGQQPIHAPSFFIPTIPSVYPAGQENHLISVGELEEATSPNVPHIISLLGQTWKRGPGHELLQTIEHLQATRREHPVLAEAWSRWGEIYDFDTASAENHNVGIFGCLRPEMPGESVSDPEFMLANA